jgi:hypothetical protein
MVVVMKVGENYHKFRHVAPASEVPDQTGQGHFVGLTRPMQICRGQGRRHKADAL